LNFVSLELARTEALQPSVRYSEKIRRALFRRGERSQEI